MQSSNYMSCIFMPVSFSAPYSFSTIRLMVRIWFFAYRPTSWQEKGKKEKRSGIYKSKHLEHQQNFIINFIDYLEMDMLKQISTLD